MALPLRRLPLAALAAMVLAAAPEPDRTQWKLSSFTWVKRVPAEAGAAPSAHPATLTAEAVQAALGPVQAVVEGAAEPLFAKGELPGLAKALAEAFALARPGEDLILLSTTRRGAHFLDPTLGVTARLFVKDGALNLLVHDARLDFMGRYSADRTLPAFVYGSRAQASTARLQAPGAAAPRPDWLALPLAAPAAAPTAAPVPAPAPQPAPRAEAKVEAKVEPKAEPAAPAEAPKDAAFYAAQRERLKALKALREEGLLTEAEYQAKREAILKTL